MTDQEDEEDLRRISEALNGPDLLPRAPGEPQTSDLDPGDPQTSDLDPGDPQNLPRTTETTGTSHRRSKLVLHVDLNNTVLVSDAVTGLGTIAALDSFLPGVTWGRMEKGVWVWLSDSASLAPPAAGAVNFYSQFGRTPGFTSTAAGKRFRPLLEEHLELLLWPEGTEEDPDLTVRGEDGRLYHWIVPSFFQLLLDLASEGPDFAVVFRTFGSDLSRVLRAVSSALTRGHPLFCGLQDLQLVVDVSPGQIRCSRRSVVVSRGLDKVSSSGPDGDRDVYRFFSSARGICGFQDHFDWWAAHSFSLRGGKPLWIDPFDLDVQHIFIDDNIRPNDKDTIVHPKVFLDPGGSQTRSSSSSELLDLCLIQTDLLQAISDPKYFTHRVQTCRQNYQRNQV